MIVASYQMEPCESVLGRHCVKVDVAVYRETQRHLEVEVTQIITERDRSVIGREAFRQTLYSGVVSGHLKREVPPTECNGNELIESLRFVAEQFVRQKEQVAEGYLLFFVLPFAFRPSTLLLCYIGTIVAGNL